MAIRIEFPARSPIGRVTIADRSYVVLATPEMIRALRIVQENINALETGILASQVGFTPSGDLVGTNVQTALVELDAEKQPKDATLTALAGLTTGADKFPYSTGTDAFSEATLTAFARSILDDVDAATVRTTLGLVIGTNVQAWNAELQALAGLTSAADKVPYFTGSGTAALADFTLAGRNLMDDADTSAQRTTLGLGSIATQDASNVSITGGTIGLASGSLGYATGNGGTVTQITSKSTGVTLNKISGEITMNNAALASGATVSFTLTNSTVAATDVMLVNIVGGVAGTGCDYKVSPVCGSGSATISVKNDTAGSLSEALVLRFVVLKGATS